MKIKLAKNFMQWCRNMNGYETSVLDIAYDSDRTTKITGIKQNREKTCVKQLKTLNLPYIHGIALRCL